MPLFKVRFIRTKVEHREAFVEADNESEVWVMVNGPGVESVVYDEQIIGEGNVTIERLDDDEEDGEVVPFQPKPNGEDH